MLKVILFSEKVKGLIMGADALKDAYFSVEEKWYGFIDKISDKLPFVGKIVDKMEEKNIPSFPVAIALLVIMIVFCLLDRRTHTYIHGWRATEKQFMELLSNLINKPEEDVSYLRYIKEGEKTAELFALQPIIYYLLDASAIINLVYSIRQ